jgi:Holliday junction resolvase
MNSRSKGARGERQWRDFLREHGFNAKRGQQFAGGPDSPDVICEEMGSKLHPEVKRVERLNIETAMRQAIKDAEEKVPYVAHRRNNCEWLVTMRASDWIELIREAL